MLANGGHWKEEQHGLSWAEQRWHGSTAGVPPSPLFTLRGRTALDVYVKQVSGNSAGERMRVRVYLVGEESRILLAEAGFQTGDEGRLISLRNLAVPAIQIEVDQSPIGSSAGDWIFTCCSWGREPTSGDDAVTSGFSTLEGSSLTLSTQPCELIDLGFEAQNDGWLWLFNSAEETEDDLRVWTQKFTYGSVNFRPAQPILLTLGLTVGISNSPFVWDPPTSDNPYAWRWQTRPPRLVQLRRRGGVLS